MISFLTVTSYTVLHKVARALEDPFVHPPNDLPANAMQAAFNLRLITTWDAVRQADDAHYIPSTLSLVTRGMPSSLSLVTRPPHPTVLGAT